MRRVATSCTKGSDRTSYLTRACCASSVPTHLSPGPPFSSLSLSLRSPSAFPSFPVSAFGVPPLYSFPRPGARRLESLFIFISFGLVCRLAARHRDYRVPATHLGNSGGPLSAARSSPTTSFPLKRARDPRGMTTDGVRPGASRTNLPSPPAAPRPSSSSSSSSSTFFFPRRSPAPFFLVTLSPLALLRPPSLSSFLFAVLFLLYLIIEPALFLSFPSFSIFSLPVSSHFIHSASPLLSPRSPFFFFRPSYPFAAVSAPSFRSFAFTLFLSFSLFPRHSLALLLSRTNYLCLISDTVDVKR